MSPGRFIIGTGRCGSTLLSRMLRINPRVLELSEFFVGLDWNQRLRRGSMTGAEFRELLRAPHPLLSMVLDRGYRPAEVTYDFDRPGARFAPTQPMPWILATTLPPLSSDADALFDAVSAFAEAQPARPPADQARALFAWLMERRGATAWVERSAGSLVYLADLAAAFPEARFLHLHRRGEEAAVSMRAHPVFRLAVMLTFQIPLGTAGSAGILSALGEDADHVSRLLASEPPAEFFGRWWSEQIAAGADAMGKLKPGRARDVRFEDLIARPLETLSEIARFLDLPDPDGSWREPAARLVGTQQGRSVDGLDAEERLLLERACAPGNRLLGRT
jgi:hypothetical protein